MARSRIVLAFLAIYLIWGSTYYAIRVAVDSIPPLAMMGARCLAAGLILYCWSRRTAPAPDGAAWRAALVAGGFLFLLSHGSLAWAEQRVASGEAALLGATTPLWLTLVDWRFGSGRMPRAWGRVGLALGFAGVTLLFAPGWRSGSSGLAVGHAAILGAAIAWAAGSVYGRGARLPGDVRQSTALQLLAGAAWLAAASAITGEWRSFAVANVTPASAAALLYLIVFGSVVAFTAYIWLLRITTAARVGTHAYVNPIVAVALGAALGGEHVSLLTLASALTIVAGVVLVLVEQSRPAQAATSALPPPPRGAKKAAAAIRLA